MATPKLAKLELKIMEIFWDQGDLSIREVQEAFPETTPPAYTTVQTTIYRLESKKVVQRVKKIGNSHIFRAAVSRSAAQRRLVDELLSLFGGRIQPVMAHLVQSRKLTPEDIAETQKLLQKHAEKEKIQ
jgi:BlaI family transcriptional regulator, penicillinase repressor